MLTMDVVMMSLRGTYVTQLRTSDDTISLEAYKAAGDKLGTITVAWVVLQSGRKEAVEFILENQEPGRVGVAA
jgi:hypothetical protein